MVERVFSPDYWRDRIQRMKGHNRPEHHMIFEQGDMDAWKRIEEQHKKILATLIEPNDSILDCGCGYGRLAYLMPTTWRGEYLGVDLSPEFIEMAERNHPDLDFVVGRLENIREVITHEEIDRGVRRSQFDWAVCISIKNMVETNVGNAAWKFVEGELKQVASRVLLLEYDENDKGEIL